MSQGALEGRADESLRSLKPFSSWRCLNFDPVVTASPVHKRPTPITSFMKTLVLFSLIATPAGALAQIPAPPESAVTREYASNAAGKSGIDGRDVISRATATSAMASRATTAPILDGKTDDPAWQNAQV